jgi:ribose/xylose/arabinose/galactoside ABC-type transport system permease subunit
MSGIASPVEHQVIPAQPRRRDSRRSAALRLARRREPLLVVMTLAVFVLTTALEPSFDTSGNINFMLESAMPLAVLAVGQTMVCLVRGIDVSVAPILGIAAVSTGFLAQDDGSSYVLMLPLALAIGAGLGLVNGLFVTYARIPPIITTLGTLSVYGGIELSLVGSSAVQTLPNSYATLNTGTILPDISYLLVIGVVVMILAALFLWRTTIGRALYAVGNNVEAAFRAGIRVNAVLVSAYALTGLIAGLAGLVYLVYYRGAEGGSGITENLNLLSIAAVLIGGTTLTGGKGGVVGPFLASIFITVADEAVLVAGVNPDWQPAGVGVLLLLAIMLDRNQSGRRSLREVLLARHPKLPLTPPSEATP